MWFIVNVEGAIVNKAGQYLMIVRGEEETHAAGALSMPGGKVESLDQNVLEATLRREIMEEVGVEVGAEMIYLESKSFTADDNDPVVDVVFLCRYKSGTPTISDPGEVAAIVWMTAAEIRADPHVPPWTRQSITLAEQARSRL